MHKWKIKIIKEYQEQFKEKINLFRPLETVYTQKW